MASTTSLRTNKESAALIETVAKHKSCVGHKHVDDRRATSAMQLDKLDALSVGAGVALSAAAVMAYKAITAPKTPSGKLYFYYFPIAGRGELSRLIAAAGGLEIEESKPGSDFNKAEYGSPSGMPLLCHGDLKISQSSAVQKYLSSLVPRFAALSPAQQATEDMFACIKEDVLKGCAQVVFGGIANAPTEIPKHCDKWFDVVEGLLPAEGFILGLGYPTVADLAVLNMARGYMPFGASYKHGKYNYALKHPKMAALVERTAATPGIKEYLASSKSLTLSFLDVDKK